MAITFDELKTLFDEQDLRYFVDPKKPTISFGMSGIDGTYHYLIKLEIDGTFIQFCTSGYLVCPEGHTYLTQVLKALGHVNFTRRMNKYGWDPSDGEIAAYADFWLSDNKLTQDQFSHMLKSYLLIADFDHVRLRTTLETGKDPGDLTEQLTAQLKNELKESVSSDSGASS